MPKHGTKNEIFIKDFFIKFDQICRNLRMWSHLLKKSLMENFIVCAMKDVSSNMNHDFGFIGKYNEFLAEYTIKKEMNI